MSKLKLNGVEINYRQAGEGDDIILIHGLAANHAFWNLKLLLPLARHYRVTTFDLRGHGYSSMPPGGYQSDNVARDLIALMDHLEIERAHLVGHSFGGVVATQCATRRPERVASLTLADTRLHALQSRQRLIDWPNWRQAKEQLLEHGIEIDEHADEVGLILLEKLADPKWRQARQALSQQALFIPFTGWSSGNRSAAKWLKLLQTTDARRELPSLAGLTLDAIRRIPHPILAIYGERSRCMKTCEGLQEEMPDVRVVIVPDSGHFFPVIKPAFVAEQLLDFLAYVETAACCDLEVEERIVIHEPEEADTAFKLRTA